MAKPGGDQATAEEITRGSGNVFAELGYPDAEERQTKLRLAHALSQILRQRHLTQAPPLSCSALVSPKSRRSSTTSSKASRSSA